LQPSSPVNLRTLQALDRKFEEWKQRTSAAAASASDATVVRDGGGGGEVASLQTRVQELEWEILNQLFQPKEHQCVSRL
jgi:hypothetical protein